jgi:PPOX class probable F420-dependent enzyme
MVLNDAVRQAVSQGHLAHLVTMNPDGSPQVTIVWVGLDGDELVTAHLSAQRKVRNLELDPRVVVSLETGGRDPSGLDHYLVIYGRATVQEGGAAELLQRLAHTYLGPEVVFPPMPNPPAGFVVRIRPDRVTGVGPWS